MFLTDPLNLIHVYNNKKIKFHGFRKVCSDDVCLITAGVKMLGLILVEQTLCYGE